MSFLRYTWDFLFGVLLIGGAPMCVMSLTLDLGDLYQSLFHVIIPEGVGFVVCLVMLVTMIVVFVYAIRFRLRRRVLPGGFVVAEALVGILGAFLLFSFYGMLMYSSIG